MIHVELFAPEDLQRMRWQERQERLRAFHSARYVEALATGGPSLTAMADGKPILCGGLYLDGEDRASLWGFFAQDAGAHFVALFRAVKRFLDAYASRRIEASVESDFPNGCRFLELLGFSRRTLRRDFDWVGADHWLYVKEP